MGKKQTPLISPRRIAVTGAIPRLESKLEQSFCCAIGEAIVEQGAIVVTRGGKMDSSREAKKKSMRPVDEFVVRGAMEAAVRVGKSKDESIETLLGDALDDRELFQIGTIRRIHGRTHEAQRFRFVDLVDGVIGICGRGGTKQTLVLGLATERPSLPVASFGGGSAEIWDSHESDVVESLGIDPMEQNLWKQKPKNEKAASALAKQMVTRLLEVMVRRCFVITPFQHNYNALYDFVIAPAVEGLGDKPMRLDRMAVPGDVGHQIMSGIQHSDYVIVVLDGMRPNVLYELGLAHGQGKPTILMNQIGTLGKDAEMVPFDLAMHQRLEYEAVDKELPRLLQKAIQAIGLDRSERLGEH